MDLQGAKLTWLGHATFYLETPEGNRVLVDPWLEGNPQCPDQYKKSESDAIVATHGHFDHIGDIFGAATRCTGAIVAIVELTTWLGKRGIGADKLIGMNKGGTVSLFGGKVQLTMTTAHHSSSWLEEDGTCTYLGDPAGYVVRLSNQLRIYFAGDTCVFGDMAVIRQMWSPQLAVLPIGDFYTMDPRQAAYACELLGVQAVVPCHYGTFPALTGTAAQLRTEISNRRLSTEVIALEPGSSAA